MTTFGEKQSRDYDQRASRLLGGLYRRIAADIDATARPGAGILDVGTGPGKLLAQLHFDDRTCGCTAWTCHRT